MKRRNFIKSALALVALPAIAAKAAKAANSGYSIEALNSVCINSI